jgi:hypothetical protein
MYTVLQVIDASGGVQWQDIAGLETVKHLIKEIVVWPMLNPHLFTVSYTACTAMGLCGCAVQRMCCPTPGVMHRHPVSRSPSSACAEEHTHVEQRQSQSKQSCSPLGTPHLSARLCTPTIQGKVHPASKPPHVHTHASCNITCARYRTARAHGLLC